MAPPLRPLRKSRTPRFDEIGALTEIRRHEIDHLEALREALIDIT